MNYSEKNADCAAALCLSSDGLWRESFSSEGVSHLLPCALCRTQTKR